ncbi:MAG: hypothetical protein WBN06_12860 [Lysobacterales bacterium]
MFLKRACFLSLVYALSMPLMADTQTEVGVAFIIDSPQVFPDQTLGDSKSQIESEMSLLIAGRLEFYFPFLEWKAGLDTDNRILIKMMDQKAGLCDWQTVLMVRAIRAGNEVEMVDVPSIPLFDLCDPFTPNRKATEGNALNAGDQVILLDTLEQAVGNTNLSNQEIQGLLNNKSIRDEIHRQFLRTIPVTQNIEIKDQNTGSGKFIYLPVSFDELKSIVSSCDDSNNCSRLRLTFNLPDSPPATFNLRIAGHCGANVLSEVLDGGVPGGFEISEPVWWDERLGNLLSQAQGMSITMEEFIQNSLACPETGEP